MNLLNLQETAALIQEEYDSNGAAGMTITISAGPYSGATMVAAIIEKALKEAGLKDVVVFDDETTAETREAVTQMFSKENIAKICEFNKGVFNIRMVRMPREVSTGQIPKFS